MPIDQSPVMHAAGTNGAATRVLRGAWLAPLLVCCAAGAGGERPLTAAQAGEDIARLRAAFEQLHPGLHTYADPADVSRFFDGLDAEQARSDVDLYRLLLPFASILRDGHTTVELSGASARSHAGTALLMPLQVHVSGGRVWVAGDYSGLSAIPAGSELLAVDDVESPDLLARAQLGQPRDGDALSGTEYALSQGFRFASALALLDGARSRYQVRFASADGTAREVVLDGATLADLRSRARRAPRPAPRSFGLTFHDDGDIGVLTIPSFAGADLPARLRTAFATLRERGTRVLIVDVRGNGGGYDTAGKQLVAHLAAREFDYYRELVTTGDTPMVRELVPGVLARTRPGADGVWRMHGHPNLGRQAPEDVTFEGPVVALMDGGSFSTTAEALAALRQQRRALFVGEESGGGFCGNTSGETAVVVLPHSGLTVHIPLVRYSMAVTCDGHRHGVRPDVAAPRSIVDRLGGSDTQLAAALSAARVKAACRRNVLDERCRP